MRKMEHVESASTMDASSLRIMFRHLIPNAMTGPAVVAILSFVASTCLPPHPRGVTPSPRAEDIRVTVFGGNFFGDGFRDALDPGLRERDFPYDEKAGRGLPRAPTPNTFPASI